jgi:hypothetical protein
MTAIVQTTDREVADRHRFSLAQYFICLKGIVWREALRFIHQRERFISALVRPLVWLRDLRALRGVYRSRLDRDDPAFQRHAIVADDGL